MAILGVVAILTGDEADLPVDNDASTEGRLYYANDTGKMYRDNGATWAEKFAMPKDGSITAAKVASDVATQAELDAVDTLIDNHIADTIAAHAATAISAAPFTGVVGDTVQEQLEEIAGLVGGAGGHEIQDDGTPLTARAALNFIPGSSGVTITDNSGDDSTDIDFSTLTGGVGGGVYEDFTEAAAPSTPDAGKVRLYAKTDGSLYQKDDAGLETGLALYPQSATIWAVQARSVVGATLRNYAFNSGQIHTHWSGMGGTNGLQNRWNFALAAGTYTMRFLGITYNGMAILKWAIDGVDVVTGQDWYSGGGVVPNVVKTETGIVVATSGNHELVSTITGRNAGNTTDYDQVLTLIEFIKE